MRCFFEQIFENSPLHSVRFYQQIFHAHFFLVTMTARHLFIIRLNLKWKSKYLISILRSLNRLRNRKSLMNSCLIATDDYSYLYLICSIRNPLNQEASFDSKDFYKMFTYSQILLDIWGSVTFDGFYLKDPHNLLWSQLILYTGAWLTSTHVILSIRNIKLFPSLLTGKG